MLLCLVLLIYYYFLWCRFLQLNLRDDIEIEQYVNSKLAVHFHSCSTSGGNVCRDLHQLRVLTASIYYVVAKVNGFVLLDVDMLPLQGEHWQTDQMLSAYFCLLTTKFSTTSSLNCNVDFSSVGSIISGSGVKRYLDTGSSLPLTSVSMHYKAICVTMTIVPMK